MTRFDPGLGHQLVEALVRQRRQPVAPVPPCVLVDVEHFGGLRNAHITLVALAEAPKAMALLLAGHPRLWVPAGSWAEWVGAVGTVGAIGWGVYAWGHDRRMQLELEESAQARLVGGYTTGGRTEPLVVHPVNSSGFQLQKVEAALIGEHGLLEVVYGGRSGEVVVLPPAPPGEYNRSVNPPPSVECHLEIAFDDDTGQRWHKYGADKPLRKVSADFSLTKKSKS